MRKILFWKDTKIKAMDETKKSESPKKQKFRFDEVYERQMEWKN